MLKCIQHSFRFEKELCIVKKLIALLLTLTMLTGMTAALAEGGKPSFEMFGNGIWSYSMLGFEDHDFLFIHTATAGTNLAQRYVYCDDDTAVFVTHGGDAMIRFTYEERGGKFYATRVEMYAAVTQAQAQDLLEAITILATMLDVCEISLTNYTAEEFVKRFTKEQDFTMNGVHVTGSIMQNGGVTYIGVVFDGASALID